MNKLISFSVNNSAFVFLGAMLLVFFGFQSYKGLSIDAVPDITNSQVQINTSVDGLIPEEIERMITSPIEFSMNGMPDVESIRSISRYGISQVTVIFKDKTDIYIARQLVNERLQNLDLPAGTNPEMGPISSGLGEIFHYSVEAKSVEKDSEKRLLQLMELRAIQDWYIKPRLLGVSGVTEVNTIGGFEKQFFIQPDVKKMSRFGLHFDDIKQVIADSNRNVGGGYVEQTGEQLLIRGTGALETIDDISQVTIKRLPSGRVIRIKDIARVRLDKEIRTGAATVNGEESIVGTAFMLLGGNSRAVAVSVREKLEDVKTNLPDWVKVSTLYDRSNMVNATLETVKHNLILGALLVMLFLMLLVGNFRAAIITSVVIPVALLVTFILMKWKGVSGNLMSLGALDFGIIVDGAVIVVENCVRRMNSESQRLGRSLSRKEIKANVIKATAEIRSAAGFGELIVIIVFVPLFALTGIEGKMFGPMATTFIMALMSALVLSFTLVPALAATFLSGEGRKRKPVLLRIAETIYKPLLNLSLRFKAVVLIIASAIILSGFVGFSNLGSEFIPKLDEGDLAFQFIRPANISTKNSVELQKISERIIKDFPQVKSVFARTGAAEVATDPMGVNISDSYIMLEDRSNWPLDENISDKKSLSKAIQEKLDLHVPGQVIMVSQPVELRFNELLEGTRSEVSAKVFGDDLDKLLDISQKVAATISTVEGAGNVETETKGKSPLLQYTPKKSELYKLGLNSGPVLETISIALGGENVGSIYSGVRKFPIITRLSDDDRKDIEILKSLPVGVSSDFTVPIYQVADLDFIETYTSISRENSQRRVAVLINPQTRDIESFVNKASSLVEQEVTLPEGYYVEWGGSFKNLISAKERLFLLVPLALLVILVMLFAAFRRFSQVALIFLCVPMSLVGGVFALKIMDMPFSISAGVGFIALAGISILNGVVLVTYFNRLYRKDRSPDDIVKEGAMSRLRPVLMTALTDVFGFLPMMFATGLGAEVQKPLATVVVGGMISATILTLVVLPSLYRLFFKFMKPKTNAF